MAKAVQTGAPFAGVVGAKKTLKVYFGGWSAKWHMIWYCVPVAPVTSPPGAPQMSWTMATERESADKVKYHLDIKNLTAYPITVEVRYAVFNL